jgi:hypothetical protein
MDSSKTKIFCKKVNACRLQSCSSVSDHLSKEIKTVIFIDEGDHLGFNFLMRRRVWINNCRILFDALNYNRTLNELMIQITELICLWMRLLFARVGHVTPYPLI